MYVYCEFYIVKKERSVIGITIRHSVYNQYYKSAWKHNILFWWFNVFGSNVETVIDIVCEWKCLGIAEKEAWDKDTIMYIVGYKR